MSCLQFLLKFLGYHRPTKRDREDALSEDVVRTSISQHDSTDRIVAAADRNIKSSDKLRDSIRRVRTSAFSDFEKSIREGKTN